jgi:hypothetical protein
MRRLWLSPTVRGLGIECVTRFKPAQAAEYVLRAAEPLATPMASEIGLARIPHTYI